MKYGILTQNVYYNLQDQKQLECWI